MLRRTTDCAILEGFFFLCEPFVEFGDGRAMGVFETNSLDMTHSVDDAGARKSGPRKFLCIVPNRRKRKRGTYFATLIMPSLSFPLTCTRATLRAR
jgi:hypothetical protein